MLRNTPAKTVIIKKKFKLSTNGLKKQNTNISMNKAAENLGGF